MFGRRRANRRRRRERAADAVGDGADCCCAVGEIFDSPCFVASAAYESEVAEPVRVLRAYRDERLVRHRAGRAFTGAYYRYGPFGARFLRRFPVLKPVARAALWPVVWAARRALAP